MSLRWRWIRLRQEAAQLLLGQEKADVTQIYAEKNLARAIKCNGSL